MRERDRHGAIMKMNANGGKGSHGRSRSLETGVLKKDLFKEHRQPDPHKIQMNGFKILGKWV